MRGRGQWKAYVLTLLCVLSAAVLSLSSSTMARYTASASVQASGRVAKWDVKFIADPTGNSRHVANGSVVYLRYGAINGRTAGSTKYFYVHNNSEVAATVTVRLRYTNTYNTFPGITSNSEWTWLSEGFGYYTGTGHANSNVISGTSGSKTVTIGPGGVATFNIRVSGNPNGASTTVGQTPYSTYNETWCLRVYFNAVQVN